MIPESIITFDNNKLSILPQFRSHKNKEQIIIHLKITRTLKYFIERHRGRSVDLRENQQSEAQKHQNIERKMQ